MGMLLLLLSFLGSRANAFRSFLPGSSSHSTPAVSRSFYTVLSLSDTVPAVRPDPEKPETRDTIPLRKPGQSKEDSANNAGKQKAKELAPELTTDTVKNTKQPASSIKKNRKGISRYFHIMTDRSQRDSLLTKLGKVNAKERLPDSVVFRRRQNTFNVYGGKKIRTIYYNQLKVFGTQIEDSTSVTNRAIKVANRLHYTSKTWLLRQSLFFREGDTVNAYTLVDNERYLRNQPFLQDARIYVINGYAESDSVDILITTKDVFEYGGALSALSPGKVAASVFNGNLLGVGQRVFAGFRWDKQYDPAWHTGFAYTKYNLGGTYADVSVGYSLLNDQPTTDTGQFERTTYFRINRPLYTSWARFTGGLTISDNISTNLYNLPDSIYRQYRYSVIDAWAGYNFRNQYLRHGGTRESPNFAMELRRYRQDFSQRPFQDSLKFDPSYNTHDYMLAKFVLFHQEFFKTNYFFGFGKTEDIPLSYNFSFSIGYDKWVQKKRTYTAIEGQKFWLVGKNVLAFNAQFGSFWRNRTPEDMVMHLSFDYYSNLFRLKNPKLREFLHADYIIAFRPDLYQFKPVNINRDFGLLGYRYTLFNNSQRLVLNATTQYYSPLNLYGFKFNFFGQVQAALLASHKKLITDSPLYTSFTLGVQVKNENLAFNTLQFSASYQPIVDHSVEARNGPKSLFIQITSVTTFRFNIFALQAPAEIAYR